LAREAVTVSGGGHAVKDNQPDGSDTFKTRCGRRCGQGVRWGSV